MKRIDIFFVFVLLTGLSQCFPAVAQYMVPAITKSDWLLGKSPAAARLEENGKTLTLTNGLLSRSFYRGPNLVCFDYKNLTSGEQLLRAVKAEARLVLNGKTYNVGGLYGQKENAYFLPEWLDELKGREADFQYVSHELKDIQPNIEWKPGTWTGNKDQRSGKVLIFSYRSGLPELKDIIVKVYYAIYDGLPLIAKRLSIENGGSTHLKIDQVVNEILATPEEESAVVGSPEEMAKPHGIYIESNFAFNNAMRADLSDQTTHWKTDSTYTSQVNYNYETPCLLEVYPGRGIGITLDPGEVFHSIRTYELLLDSYDRERNGLARRKMYRTIAPWITQNPIFMHLVSTEPAQVRAAVDQCAETGYEGIILSFGSGLNMEDTSAANIQKYRDLAEYAHERGVLLGGYSLFSSRSIGPETDVIDPKTGKPGGAFFGNAPCLGSQWGLDYLEKLKYFFEETGFDIFENDGPYPGDVCASASHPGHQGLQDSQWKQMELQKGLYHWLNERGVYINAPDWYFLDGTHKIALGYREVNFSLPRAQQIILNRQNIYDGTWEKTPSMGWGFVPLTQYHGGGAAATLEPLKEHLDAYEQLMMQYYGAGVQACYRGPRLYDSEETKQLVKEVVSWYKKYRDILNADIIHLRRPDGRDWDGIMHVDPNLATKGLVMLYNPLDTEISQTIHLPLYYTGLTKTAAVRVEEGPSRVYSLDRNYTVGIQVTIPGKGYTWLTVE
ncbi:alpha-galactosidase [Anseongella ginsenosidimutans]|nr:alpha-galactosidase [Anseongella ginsenosidimutans]QEC53511.1 alpha-galactosidase [Anseongella ginsenosidimutans]